MDDKKTKNEPQFEKIIDGNAKKKRPKLSDIFTTEDIGNVRYYLIKDVLIPNIKKLIHDIVTNGIDMFLYRDGEGRGEKSSISRPSYRKYYDDGQKDTRSSRSDPRNRFGYADVVVNDRGEAEDILSTLEDACDMYDGFVTVGALYDMAGVDHNKYTDYDYGWTRPMLRDAKIIRERDGYLIKMPRPVPID